MRVLVLNSKDTQGDPVNAIRIRIPNNRKEAPDAPYAGTDPYADIGYRLLAYLRPGVRIPNPDAQRKVFLKHIPECLIPQHNWGWSNKEATKVIEILIANGVDWYTTTVTAGPFDYLE